MNRYRCGGAFLFSICAIAALSACHDDPSAGPDAGLADLEASIVMPPVREVPLGIAGSYHGILHDRWRKPIKLTVQGALAKQEELVALVLQTKKGADLASKRAAIVGNRQLSLVERIVINDGLLEWAVSTDQQVAEAYDATHGWLSTTAIDLARLTPDFYQRRIWLADILRRLDLSQFFPILRARRDGKAYQEQCRAAGVPFPPSWPSSDWVSNGDLPVSKSFLPSDGVSVYSYRDPAVPGLCIALPRTTTTGEIDLMGFICQSATTGKTCYWDNLDAVTGSRIRGPLDTTRIDMLLVQNGNSLRSNCTSCHRGDNSFIQHPGTALDFGAEAQAAVWPSPVTTQAWSNPPALRARGSSPCSSCHAIAALSAGYCGDVLMPALGSLTPEPDRTMPPYGMPLVDYAADARALSEACGAAVPPVWPPATPGAASASGTR